MDGHGLAYFELEINALGTEFDLFLDRTLSRPHNSLIIVSRIRRGSFPGVTTPGRSFSLT